MPIRYRDVQGNVHEMPGIPGVLADLSAYATKKQLENKIDKNGETEHLSINDTFKIDSLDGQGYVQLTVRGTEDNKDEVLNLDTLLGTDLRIVGIYRVIGDYDITNKKYVDDAISTALTTIDNAETLSF